jgi:hypothetical protein
MSNLAFRPETPVEKLLYAAAGFVVGLVVGCYFTMQYMEEDFAQQQRTTLMLHGDRRASECQLPEASRPKGLDCRGLTP